MKKTVVFMLLGLMLMAVTAQPVYAEEASPDEKLTLAQRKALLTEVAIEKQIPPEILKAIAMIESKMRQFDENGEPLGAHNEDGGIGMMQITLNERQKDMYDVERLKTDTRYNIEVGADILLDKWNSSVFPVVNNKDWRVLEHWYFALLGYNGRSKINDPAYTPDEPAYQERIYETIENHSLTPELSFGDFEVEYPYDDFPTLIAFKEDWLDWKDADTMTSQIFREHDLVVTFNDVGVAYVRGDVDGERIATLPLGERLKIVDGPFENNDLFDHFVYYKVRGDFGEGYIASSNLAYAEVEKDESFEAMKEKPETAGKEKIWTIAFNTAMDVDTILNQTIYVEDENGNQVRTMLEILDGGKTVKVHPPENGYSAGKTYTLYVQSQIKTMKGLALKAPKKITFNVK